MTRRFEEDTFELPGLILCEGAADRQFLSRLMINRGFGTDIYVQYPRGAEHSGGKDKFAAYLRGISVSETFIKNVRAVLLVADNDDAPDDAFRAVQEALAAASFPVPSAPGEYAAHSSGPPTV